MNRLKKKLRGKSIELWIVFVVFLFSFRVLNWFEYPYIVIGGDLKPPLVHEAFVKRVIYAWDETDFGLPSVYPPRILDPFYFFVTAFQAVGVELFTSQIIAVFLLYFFSSILMYFYVKQLTNGDFIAAFVATLFLTSNIHLITDRELTAIGFMDSALMILPCLVLFTRGIKTKSYKLMTISGVAFALTYGWFPNYAVTLLCLITLVLTCLFMLMYDGLKVSYTKNETFKKNQLNISINVNYIFAHLKLVTIFILSLSLTSVWIIAIILENFATLSAAINELGAPLWAMAHIGPCDVLRLIAKWGFYESAWGHPYVYYANRYLQNGDPLIIFLSYIPPILAFSSLLTSKSRKLTIYFSGVAVLSLFLTSGFSPYFNKLYFALVTNIPLMIAFREPMKWIFIVVLCYGILIGVTLSNLCHKLRNKALQLLALGLTILLFLSTSFPLTTGDVTRNWLRTDIKGGYFPSSYDELNSMLSNEYWALIIPKKQIYLAYDFVQGNLSCGNPYPLIFSKPIISGAGTEYLQAKDPGLIDGIHQILLRSSDYENEAPKGNVLASSIQMEGLEPSKAIDGQDQTRWASSVSLPQWFEIEWNQTREISKVDISFGSAFAEDFDIETWNGTDWITQITKTNNTARLYQHDFQNPISATKVRLYFTKASNYRMVDILELQIYARTEGVYKLLGTLGIKYLILEKNMTYGNAYPIDDLRLNEKKFALHAEWEELLLLENLYALQKFYVANVIYNGSTLNSIYEFVEDLDWNTLKHSMFINTTSHDQITGRTLAMPENFSWLEISPTEYKVYIKSTGSFILGFLENYDEHWKLYVNGKHVPEANRLKKINGFANGWVIDTVGDLTITLEYETQKLFIVAIAASIILPFFLLVLLSKRELKMMILVISRRLQISRAKRRQEASKA